MINSFPSCGVLIFMILSALELRAEDTQNAGYVAVFAGTSGENEWSVACLDLPLTSTPPPPSKTYHNQLAVLWATLFQQATLAVPPSLVNQKSPVASESSNRASSMDSETLFTEFNNLCHHGSLLIDPLLKLTPSSGLTCFQGISSTDRSPVLVLVAAKPDIAMSWTRFTKLGAECFAKVTDMPFRVDEDAQRAELFWRKHIPQTLSRGMTKVSLRQYLPDRGVLLYRCESENYQGMAQAFLDFLTRP